MGKPDQFDNEPAPGADTGRNEFSNTAEMQNAEGEEGD